MKDVARTHWAEVQAVAGQLGGQGLLSSPLQVLSGCLGLLCSRLVPGSKDELCEGWEALDVTGLQAHLLYLQRP